MDVGLLRGVNENALAAVWRGILKHGEPYISHWLFPGWLTLISYTLICLYFTWKDVFRHNSKIQKDWWPSWGDMARAALPQLAIYFGLNAIFTYLYSQHIELPLSPPSLLRFSGEVLTSFVVGDFLIYT